MHLFTLAMCWCLCETADPEQGVTLVAAAMPERLDAVNQLVHQLVREQIPSTYENTKQWGGTKEIWHGIRIRREGLRIKTKRRKKHVNHGTWKRYRAWLINPDDELEARISNLRPLDQGRVSFRLTVVARLGTLGRLSEWRRGIQLISLSANATARVRLQLDCELGSQLDFSDLPPALVIVPRVTNARLELLEFRLERLSELSGPLAKELGESLHNVLQDGINQRRAKLVNKINHQLDKHRDDLRLSVREIGSRGWTELLRFLNIREA